MTSIITLQNMPDQRYQLKRQQLEALSEYWQEYFREAATLLETYDSDACITVSFKENQHCVVDSVDVFMKPQELYDVDHLCDIVKCLNAGVPNMIDDFPRLDSDDSIVISKSGVEARFRHYHNWDFGTIKPSANDDYGLAL